MVPSQRGHSGGLYLIGVATGAAVVATSVHGNVGHYHVAEGNGRSGWVHDGVLHVPHQPTTDPDPDTITEPDARTRP